MSEQSMRTPRWLFELLSARFGPFTLDVAADPDNSLCEYCHTEATDGLAGAWHASNWCNPPFGNVGDWVARAHTEAVDNGATTCMIVPAGCSQGWWHRYARCWSVFYPTKRINFCRPDGSPTKQADRDTCVLVVGPKYRNKTSGFKACVLDVTEAGRLS